MIPKRVITESLESEYYNVFTNWLESCVNYIFQSDIQVDSFNNTKHALVATANIKLQLSILNHFPILKREYIPTINLRSLVDYVMNNDMLNIIKYNRANLKLVGKDTWVSSSGWDTSQCIRLTYKHKNSTIEIVLNVCADDDKEIFKIKGATYTIEIPFDKNNMTMNDVFKYAK